MNTPQTTWLTDSATLQKLIGLTHALSAERHMPRLYEQIIEAAREFTNADGATLYIVKGEGKEQKLCHEVMHTDSLGIRAGGTSGNPVTVKPIPLWLPDGSANHANVCAHVWHSGRLTNIADVYQVKDFDFTGTFAFDKAMPYRTTSLLTLPLENHAGTITGVLQLVNARSADCRQIIPFVSDSEPLILALASSAAVTLDKQQLIQAHKDLLDAFIRAIAQAIDAKSAHTSAHCQRVPAIAEMLADAACQAKSGPLAGFSLDEEGWYELRVAAWMHDCGKLSTPDYLLDKASKLHALSDRIECVRARFAALGAQTRLLAAEGAISSDELAKRLAAVADDCAFIEKANAGGEFMRPEDQARVRSIAQQTWRDHAGNEVALLSDDEVAMLCIERGTLSNEERQRINHHIDVTISMLESLPFPRHLARVPEYAGGHHEKMDGSGFPRGLKGSEMSWPARMIAIADIFEALTARDRPYKQPMPLSQALAILRSMSGRHIDPDLFHLFLDSRIWQTYAEKYLLPEQNDVSDPTPYY